MAFSETINLKKINHSRLVLQCPSKDVEQEIYDTFSFFAPGYKYSKKYRKGIWDGKIKLFDRNYKTFPAGLYEPLREFCSQRGYDIQIYENPPYGRPDDRYDLLEKDLDSFLENLPLPFNPHPHQREAVLHTLRSMRSLLVSPVGSGKSFIIYLILRYLTKFLEGKILIVVPTTNLVGQMYSDFEDYAIPDPDFSIEKNFAQILAGADKENLPKCVISTWQSIYKMDQEWFDQFEVVFGDEAHLFASDSTSKLMRSARKAKWRIGTTGTLKDSKMHELQLQGHFGPTKIVSTIKELQDLDILSDLSINIIRLSYPDEIKKSMRIYDPKIKKSRYLSYAEELDLLSSIQQRNMVIRDLTLSLKGNTLVLYRLVDRHGIPLHQMIQEAAEFPVHFVSGKIDAVERNRIRKAVEESSRSVIVASYETFSTGMNIKNLRNVIFAAPYKSKVKVIQSMGRTLRKSEDGQMAQLYDIIDEISVGKSYMSYATRHGLEREKLYTKEKLKIGKKVGIKINDIQRT